MLFIISLPYKVLITLPKLTAEKTVVGVKMYQVDINRQEDGSEQPPPLATSASEVSSHVGGHEGSAANRKKQSKVKIFILYFL